MGIDPLFSLLLSPSPEKVELSRHSSKSRSLSWPLQCMPTLVNLLVMSSVKVTISVFRSSTARPRLRPVSSSPAAVPPTSIAERFWETWKKYKVAEYGLTFTEKWNTDNTLGTEVTVQDQIAKGLKVTFDSTFAPT